MTYPFGDLFGQGFMPHGHCYLWTPSMVWTQVSSNLVIGLAYVSIAVTLAILVRRIRKIPFAGVYVAFGGFILSCGLTHFLDVVTVWDPIYWVDAAVRAVTAVASAGTAILMVPLLPRAAELANAARLSEERRTALERAHEQLEAAHRELAATNARLAAKEREATQRAEASEVQFRELIDNLPELAWTALPDGHIDFYNRRWFEYTGTTFAEMQGWGWEKVHDPEMLPLVVEKWKHSLTTGTPFEMEFRLRGADGVLRWFLTRIQPLRDANDTIVRWFGSNTNVDEKRKTRDALARTVERERAARQEAQAATRAKDEFLAAVSHELRTPLNAILGWSRMLVARQLQPEQIRRALDTIERNALAQVQLVDDLLDVSRIITGKLRLEVQPVDLQRVIEAAVETLGPSIQSREIRLQVVCDPQATAVVGDAARLQQVLWNVIGNAVKFSDKGGRVVVALSRVSSHVEITVTDWGKGIAPEFLPYLFEYFRQADGSTTRAYGGLGLGLAIAKHIVELHGGEISASSEGAGKGTSIVIVLPRGAARSSSANDEHPTAPIAVPLESFPELSGLRVLVVDDEADARDVTQALLEECGAVVTLARSSREALELLERDPTPDVILSDIGMPEEDGYAFIRKARLLPKMEKVPAAALTAFARAEDRRRVLASGFQMHVAKPAEPGELLAAVANLARIRKAML